MGASQVILTVISGPLKGITHVIEGEETCRIGRARDCDVQLAMPNDSRFANISRHHCEIELNPPQLRDLGSRNGTWLNGKRIGHSSEYLENEADRSPGEFVPINDGDEITVGFTMIHVRVPINQKAATFQLESRSLI